MENSNSSVKLVGALLIDNNFIVPNDCCFKSKEQCTFFNNYSNCRKCALRYS